MVESTAVKWHVNLETGQSGVCRAGKRPCRFRSIADGGIGLGHFDNKREALAAYEGYAMAMAKANGGGTLSKAKKTAAGDTAAKAAETAPKTISDWQNKLKAAASVKMVRDRTVNEQALRRLSNNGFIDPAKSDIQRINGVDYAAANIGKKYLTVTNTNGAVDKYPLDKGVTISRPEPTDAASTAMSRLRRINEIEAETSRERHMEVSGLADGVLASVKDGKIDSSAIMQYNEATAKLGYFDSVKSRIEAGDTPEQAKLNAAANAIDKYRQAVGSGSHEDKLALKAVASAAMQDIREDYDLREDAQWTISSDAERKFEEELDNIGSRNGAAQAVAHRAMTMDLTNVRFVDAADVQRLARARAIQNATSQIKGKFLSDMIRENGKKPTMFEAARAYVLSNGVSFDPYNRSTSTISNAREDGLVDARMEIASLVFKYASKAKR